MKAISAAAERNNRGRAAPPPLPFTSPRHRSRSGTASNSPRATTSVPRNFPLIPWRLGGPEPPVGRLDEDRRRVDEGDGREAGQADRVDQRPPSRVEEGLGLRGLGTLPLDEPEAHEINGGHPGAATSSPCRSRPPPR